MERLRDGDSQDIAVLTGDLVPSSHVVKFSGVKTNDSSSSTLRQIGCSSTDCTDVVSDTLLSPDTSGIVATPG